MFLEFLVLFGGFAAVVLGLIWLGGRKLVAAFDAGYELGRRDAKEEFGPLTEKLKQAVQAEGELAKSNERLTKALDRLAL